MVVKGELHINFTYSEVDLEKGLISEKSEETKNMELIEFGFELVSL